MFCGFFIKAAKSQLNADFTVDKNSGCGAVGVQFTNTSTGASSSATYNWNFGNGNSSTLQNPFENYGTTGTFTVSLTITDGANSNTETKTNLITVYRNPVADFTYNPLSGCPPLPVTLTSTSTPGDGPIVTYIWDLDDGNRGANISSITHNYENGGPYNPSLQVIDANGCSDSKVGTNPIAPTPAPTANFTTNGQRVGCVVPDTIYFVSTSTPSASIVSYRWDFGDGQSSNLPNPSHEYTTLGKYDVRLIVTDANCSDTITKIDYVQLVTTRADFSTAKDTFCLGEEITFTNTSDAADTYQWQFGDNSGSFFENPKHTYADSGLYTVTLISRAGANCTDQVTKQIYVQKVIANFGYDPLLTCNKIDTILFIDSSTNANLYQWKIQNYVFDSLKSYIITYDTFNTKNVSHPAVNENIFTDRLIVESHAGCRDTLVRTDRATDTIYTQINLFVDSIQHIDFSACPPFTVSFGDSTENRSSIVSYFWDFGNGLTFSGRTPPDILYDTVSYNEVRLTVTNNLGCSSTDIATIAALEKQPSSFTVFPDSICQGDTLYIVLDTFSTNYTTIIVKSLAGGSITNKYPAGVDTAIFENFPDTGYYSIEVLTGNACPSKTTLSNQIYINGPVVKTRFILDDCSNPLRVNFSPSTLSGFTRFSWDFGDGSNFNTVDTFPIHTFPKDTIYKITLTAFNDSNNCGPQVDTAIINLSKKNAVQRLVNPDVRCEKTALRLKAPNDYKTNNWIINSNSVGNSADTIFSSDKFTYGSNVIVFIGLNDLGCNDTIIDTLFISNINAGFSSDIRGGCLPYSVNFQDTSTSDTTIVSWRWIFTNDISDTLITRTPSKTFNQSGFIGARLKVTDAVGCTDSILIPNYLNAENPRADYVTVDDLTICTGDSVRFLNRSTGLNPIFIWDFGDGVIDTLPLGFNTHIYNSAGTFAAKLIVEDENGCKDSLVRATVNIEAYPQAGFTSDTNFATCYPLAVNFQDTSSGNIVQWLWDLGDGDSVFVRNPFRNYTSPGNYDIKLKVETANGCIDSISKSNYIQISGPTADFTIDKDTVCLNENITFTISSQTGVDNFRWAFGDGGSSTNNPATYAYSDTAGLITASLIISDASGTCEVFIGKEVNVSNVIAKFSVDDTSGCEPFQIRINNEMQGENTFSWNFGNGDNSNQREPNYIYENAGVYNLTLSISSAIGCLDDATQQIVVRPKPTITLDSLYEICLGDTALLNANGGIIYSWFPTNFLSNPNSNITKAFPDSTSIYSVAVENASACLDTASTKVYVQQAATDVLLNDTSLIIGEEIGINANAGPGFNYFWSPSLGLSCNTCATPIAKPLETTTYLLNISDILGCFSINKEITIEVIENYSLDVPKAFTPNGDGNNDIIYARGAGLKELIAFRIYNRFGELVFETSDFDKGWDGVYKGQPQNIDTYVYVVEALTYSEKILSKKGNISLLR